MSTESFSPFMTVSQAAEELHVARKTIYQWIDRGFLAAGRLPGGVEIRIRRRDWQAFTDSLFGNDVRLGNQASPVKEATNMRDEHAAAQARHEIPSGNDGPRDFFALGATRPSKQS